MQYFQIAEEDLRKVIKQGLQSGSEYVDIYLEHATLTNVSMLPEGENRAAQNIDYGAGIRCVCGDKTGYAYTEQISLPDLMKAVKQAASLHTGRVASAQPYAKAETCAWPKEVYRTQGYDFQPDGRQIEAMVTFLKQLREKVLGADARLVNVSGSIRHQVQRIAIVNSLGVVVEEMRPMSSVNIQAVIRHEGMTESANVSRSYRMPLDLLTEQLQEDIVEHLVKKLHFALTAKQPQGGEMPVVMGAGASGILLHEAIGHAFEADFVRRGESIFTDLLGKKICSEEITVVDDGITPNMRGSIHYDDEGTPSQYTPIVTEGRLTSFLHDRISAHHFGIASTGNGRRESFRSMPLPRMRNTYMLNGKSREEDLIADVKQGIYVTDFTNGQVQIGAGDYSFYVKAGYLIENGHLTQPIKDVNVMGNGPQTLADIKAVANNLIIDPSTWMCGKEGQSCPVSCGMPSVLVSKLSVG